MKKFKCTIGELDAKFALMTSVSVMDDKLTYAIKKLLQRYDEVTKAPLKKMNDKIKDFNINLCLTEENGALITKVVGNQERYAFTKEDTKKSDKNIATLNEQYLATVVEIEPFLISNPSNGYERAFNLFDTFDREQLDGLLFDVKAYEKWRTENNNPPSLLE